MKNHPNFDADHSAVIRVSIWSFSILGQRTHFDNENIEFRVFRIIMKVKFHKKNTKKWRILKRESLVAVC